uniref:Uncharacterized protein n=1 Tax=Ciona intestinalis TaxID=7719 RepID=H2XPH3_CIOIN
MATSSIPRKKKGDELYVRHLPMNTTKSTGPKYVPSDILILVCV